MEIPWRPVADDEVPWIMENGNYNILQGYIGMISGFRVSIWSVCIFGRIIMLTKASVSES